MKWRNLSTKGVESLRGHKSRSDLYRALSIQILHTIICIFCAVMLLKYKELGDVIMAYCNHCLDCLRKITKVLSQGSMCHSRDSTW